MPLACQGAGAYLAVRKPSCTLPHLLSCLTPEPSSTPAGLGTVLPVKAGLDSSSFCVPYKALASVPPFLSNPLNLRIETNNT